MWPFGKHETTVQLPQVETHPIPQEEGLQLRFKVGQQFPWHGIWFVVTRVDKESIEIKPVSMTWRREKELKKIKTGGRWS